MKWGRGRTEGGLDEMVLNSLPALTCSGSVADYEQMGPFTLALNH